MPRKQTNPTVFLRPAPFAGVLGFRVHQSYESQETGYLSALLGFGPELQCTLLELRQQWQPAGPAAHDAPAAPAAPATAAEAAADAAAVLVDLPSPRARRPAAAAPGGQQLVRFVVEKPDLQAAADRLRVRLRCTLMNYLGNASCLKWRSRICRRRLTG